MVLKIKNQILPLSLGVIIFSFLLTLFVLAWQEPTLAPPGGNVEAPLNVSNVQQWKEGGLGVGVKTFDLGAGELSATKFYDRNNNAWYVDP